MLIPAPRKLTESQLASSSMNVLMMSWNTPSEKKVMGSEMMLKNGFTSVLTMPRKRLTKRKQSHGSAPNALRPGMNQTAMASAMAVMIQLSRKRMAGSLGFL